MHRPARGAHDAYLALQRCFRLSASSSTSRQCYGRCGQGQWLSPRARSFSHNATRVEPDRGPLYSKSADDASQSREASQNSPLQRFQTLEDTSKQNDNASQPQVQELGKHIDDTSRQPSTSKLDGLSVKDSPREPKDPESIEGFRDLLSTLTNSVVVLTAQEPNSAPTEDAGYVGMHGVTLSSFTTVTIRPTPYISFNISDRSRTIAAIMRQESPRICIHLLDGSEAGVHVAHSFTQRYEQSDEPFVNLAGDGASISQGQGAPRIQHNKGVIAWLNCSSDGDCILKTVGDHHICLFRVDEWILAEHIKDSSMQTSSALGYHDRKYAKASHLPIPAQAKPPRSTKAPTLDTETGTVDRPIVDSPATAAYHHMKIGTSKRNSVDTLSTRRAIPSSSPISITPSPAQSNTYSTHSSPPPYSSTTTSPDQPSKPTDDLTQHSTPSEPSPSRSSESTEYVPGRFSLPGPSPNGTSGSANYFAESEPKVDPSVLKETVDDFLANSNSKRMPRMRWLETFSREAHLAWEELQAKEANGTLKWFQKQELENIIVDRNRFIARRLANHAATDLIYMLDQGHVSRSRVQYMEKTIERGQAVLVAEGRDLEHGLRTAGLDVETKIVNREVLLKEEEHLRTALQRLRDYADEDEGTGFYDDDDDW